MRGAAQIAMAGAARLGAFLREERGNTTLEFVVLVVPLLYIIFTIAELGVFMTRNVMLARGTDIAIREVRLGSLEIGTETTEDGTVLKGKPFKEKICENAFLIADCVSALQVEMRPLADVTQFGTGTVDCVDRTQEANPVTTFNPGARGQFMFVRVCLVVDPLFPGVGLGAQLPTEADGGYAIVSETAFLNEPS